MNMKKNITVATLAALLAVPAFNGTNLSKDIHIPSVTAHASKKSSGLNSNYFDGNSSSSLGNHKKSNNHSQLSDHSHKPNINHKHVQAHVAKVHAHKSNALVKLTKKMKSMGAKHTSSGEIVLKHNGHQFTLTGTDTGVLVDGQPVLATQALALLDKPNTMPKTSKPSNHKFSSTTHSFKPKTNNSASTAKTNSNSQSNNSSNSSKSNNSTQYSSKSNLPQTGEASDKGELALGATALMASASLAALSMSEKHREMAVEETRHDNVTTGNGKYNTHKYTDKSNYDMIMSRTFDSISNELKNL